MSGSTIWPAGILSPTDPRVSAALASWAAAADPENLAGALAAVVARVAEANAVEVGFVVDGAAVEPAPAVLAAVTESALPPETLLHQGAWIPGFFREALLSSSDRRRGGIHHTSPEMARTLVELATRGRPLEATDLVVDPATGGGAFLLAVAEVLDGDRPSRVRRLRGMDLDPLAVATTEASLRIWAEGAALAEGAVVVADALDDPWPVPAAALVIGNPPFLAQLRDGTVRDAARREAIAARWPDLRGYVDDAAAFLLAAVDATVDGGVVALVQPSSVLAARDAEPVRRRLVADAPPVAVWIDGDRQFSASVDTVALVLAKGAEPGPVERVRGVPATALPSHPPLAAASWASVLLVDTPPAPGVGPSSGTLADVAHVTAGFRDQFYGLRGAVSENGDGEPKLITSGLIDPLECTWGTVACRFDKQRWTAPTVDPAAVDPSIAGWVADRLVPKLVIASQTRVLEVAIDAKGEMVPCTPVITVEPATDGPSLAHLAAALTSPALSLLLLNDMAGSALSSDAMRVSARALGRLPLPAEGAAWDAAAAAVAALDGPPSRDELIEIGNLGLAAYGLGERVDISNWWQSRLRRR